MQFRCKYCKLIWDVEYFREIEEIQSQECYVTIRGFKHQLKAVLTKKGGLE